MASEQACSDTRGDVEARSRVWIDYSAVRVADQAEVSGLVVHIFADDPEAPGRSSPTLFARSNRRNKDHPASISRFHYSAVGASWTADLDDAIAPVLREAAQEIIAHRDGRKTLVFLRHLIIACESMWRRKW